MLAHIGNIPVEEWVPFVVPVLLLYLWGRRSTRKRHAALQQISEQRGRPSEATAHRVLKSWRDGGHEQLGPEYVELFYPPGLDGTNGPDLAARMHTDKIRVDDMLETLADLGYVDLEEEGDDRRAWLTSDGYVLAQAMEDAVLEEHKHHTA